MTDKPYVVLGDYADERHGDLAEAWAAADELNAAEPLAGRWWRVYHLTEMNRPRVADEQWFAELGKNAEGFTDEEKKEFLRAVLGEDGPKIEHTFTPQGMAAHDARVAAEALREAAEWLAYEVGVEYAIGPLKQRARDIEAAHATHATHDTEGDDDDG